MRILCTHRGIVVLAWQDSLLYVLGAPQEVPQGFEQHLDAALQRGILQGTEDSLSWCLPGHPVPLAGYHQGQPRPLRAYGQPARPDNFVSALCDWVDYVLDDTTAYIGSIS